ncbi:MAG TPA: hypothetical protein VHL79_06370 [Ramlibacter sp.]|jgi:hypothetical protein|nr:hypothetical protein [Ramlibacter sp.]
MSAFDKNTQALVTQFGSDALAQRLLTTRIGVHTSDSRLSARLLGDVLADCIARLWPNIDFCGVWADRQLQTAESAVLSGSAPGTGLKVAWADSYDVVLQIGDERPPASAPLILRVAADGWMAYLGPEGHCSDEGNPVGPAFAAAIASAQVFRHVFRSELADIEPEAIDKLAFDVRQICGTPLAAAEELDLDGTVFMGTGAVTHALLWLLENWPKKATGAIDLVDPDPYGSSNGQRYAFMRPFAGKAMKVSALAERLRLAHPSLTVKPCDQDLNTYCQERGYALPIVRAVTGLDSPEARRQAALKLPQRTINLWTDEHRCGGSRFAPDGDAACLACEYVEDVTAAMDETAEFQLETGLQPQEVRQLLDASGHLTPEQAATVARHRGVPVEKLLDMPLRSVRPVLCASATVQVGADTPPADVPFAFSSLLAGVAGFMMLLSDLRVPQGSVGWNQHVFKAPSKFMHSPRYMRAGCACCSLVYADAAGVNG